MRGSINLVTKIQSFNSAELAAGGRFRLRPKKTPPSGEFLGALKSLLGSTGYLVVQSQEMPVVHPAN
jgi:hypothetical protein